MKLEDLKFELFDTIAKVKNSMDIVAIKEETDTIFERYKAKNTEEDYFDIPSFCADIYLVITAYNYMKPDFPLKDRLLVVDGMIFEQKLYVDYQKEFDAIEDPVKRLAISLDVLEQQKDLQQLSKKEKKLVKLGATLFTKLQEHEKRKEMN